MGILSRLVYAEMAGGDDNAKSIVAESAINRTKRPINSYENPNGTLTGAINVPNAYDVTKTGSTRNDEFLTPYVRVNSNSQERRAWLSSIQAAYKAINGSNVGNGTTTYNSSNPNLFDNNKGYEKINLSITHNGILGTWKLK